MGKALVPRSTLVPEGELSRSARVAQRHQKLGGRLLEVDQTPIESRNSKKLSVAGIHLITPPPKHTHHAVSLRMDDLDLDGSFKVCFIIRSLIRTFKFTSCENLRRGQRERERRERGREALKVGWGGKPQGNQRRTLSERRGEEGRAGAGGGAGESCPQLSGGFKSFFQTAD